MLFVDTVKPDTLLLLNKLMRVDELSAFALVGGTNLSLRFGHRISVDLNLFTNEPFERDEVLNGVKTALPQTILLDQRRQTIWLTIDDVKVDLILHQYPYLKGIEMTDSVRFLAIEDIIPMKLEAMATRGVKKDFWDIAELLRHFTLSQMLDFYRRKYTNSDPGHVLLAMTYFVDAEIEKVDPMSINGMTWEHVKDKMSTTVNEYVKESLNR